MPISSSDGNVYDTEAQAAAAQFSEPPRARITVSKGPGQSNEGEPVPHIDRDHDVPLGAAALDDGSGEAYGTAVDRGVPSKVNIQGVEFDPALAVHEHEMAEHAHMEKLTQDGMPDLQAYSKAHDELGTPADKKYVQEIAKANGKDPESFFQEYQDHWKGWVDAAQETDPTLVHPHTYVKPYEPILRQKMEKAMDTYFENKERPDKLVMPGQEKRLEQIQGAKKSAVEFLSRLDNTVYNSQMHGAYTEGQGPAMFDPVHMAAEVAMNVMFTPAPVVAKTVDGTLGIMAGVGAKTTNFSKVAEAMSLDRRGFDPDSIWRETGFYKGSDGRWRHEIVDKDAYIKDHDFFDSAPNRKFLSEVLHHPELFNNYPSFGNIEVAVDAPTHYAGMWDAPSNTIFISEHSKDPMRTLLHELQHAVQSREGFVQGTSPQSALSDALYYIYENMRKLNKDSPEYKDMHALYVRLYMEDHADKLYYANRGEREARLVEVRSKFDREYLRSKSPDMMYKVLEKQYPEEFPPESLVPPRSAANPASIVSKKNSREAERAVVNEDPAEAALRSIEDAFRNGHPDLYDAGREIPKSVTKAEDKIKNPKELKLEQANSGGGYTLLNEAGHTMANLSMGYDDYAKTVHVGGLYAISPYEKNDLGPRTIIRLREELRRLFPEAERAVASRVSGARMASGKGSAHVEISLLSKEERVAGGKRIAKQRDEITPPWYQDLARDVRELPRREILSSDSLWHHAQLLSEQYQAPFRDTYLKLAHALIGPEFKPTASELRRLDEGIKYAREQAGSPLR